MKKRGWKRVLSAVLSAVLVFSSCVILDPGKVNAQDTAASVTVSTDKKDPQRGDIITVSVNLSGNEDGAGFQLMMNYDTEKLAYVEGSLANGEVVNNFVAGDIPEIIVNDTGIFNVVLLRNYNNIDNGNICTAQFRVLDSAVGDLGLEIGDVFLIDQQYADIPVNVDNQTEDMKAYIPVTGLQLDKTSMTLAKGESEKLTATTVPAEAEASISWTSSNTDVATVDQQGNVTAVGKGTADIIVKAGEMTANCRVTVNVPLEGISISGDTDTIKKGQTLQLYVEYEPEDADTDGTVTWTSSNTSVATVNGTGLVTALADGKTTITAEVDGKTATYDVTVQEIKLTSIEIKENTLIHKGESETLTVTYNPSNTTDSRTVTWTTSDASVATVDGSGKVTAIKPGQAEIRAQVGNCTDVCLVTVDAPLKAIVPSVTGMSMVKGQAAQLTWTLNPSDTTDSKDVTLSSSDASVVAIDDQGRMTAKKAGNAVITLAGANNVTATVDVEVTEIPINAISLSSQSKTLEKMESFELSATILPENNTDDDQTITWSSSDPSIITVAADSEDSTKAVVTATDKGGTAVITATAWNGTKAECTVKVLKHIESIQLPKEGWILRGYTATLTAEVLPGDTDDDKTVTWSSSNPEVLSVDAQTGTITAIKEGTARIKATSLANPEISAEMPYTVIENHLTDDMANTIYFEKMDRDVLKGQTWYMDSMLNLTDILIDYAITDDISVTWSVDDENVASIDQSGVLLGVSEGEVEITVVISATNGSGETKSWTVSTVVNVKEIPLESIAFDKVITEMQTGATEQLHILYQPENTTDDLDVIWSSSDESIISVENGKLTAKKAGTATITAKVGDQTISCTITVKDQPTQVITPGVNGEDPAAPGVSEINSPKTGEVATGLFLIIVGAGVVLFAVNATGKRRKTRR